MTSYLFFARSKIPEDIRIQLTACLKEEWDWIFAGDECFWDIIEKHNHPVSFVALENRLLVGYAEVTRRSLKYVDGRYNVYGLGAVFTRREYRNRGYGIQVVMGGMSRSV